MVLLAVAWAWYEDVSLLGDPREHLLPDFLLMTLALPTSMTLNLVGAMLMKWPLAELAWLTLCGALQASLLCWLTQPRRLNRL